MQNAALWGETLRHLVAWTATGPHQALLADRPALVALWRNWQWPAWRL